jgi:hypothetical protein
VADADLLAIEQGGVMKRAAAATVKADCLRVASGVMDFGSAFNVKLDTTTGTKIGTGTTQKLGFWNVTPVVQPGAIANITSSATSGSLPTANGTVVIADAATPTVAELLEYCVELEAKVEAMLAALRAAGLIAT